LGPDVKIALFPVRRLMPSRGILQPEFTNSWCSTQFLKHAHTCVVNRIDHSCMERRCSRLIENFGPNIECFFIDLNDSLWVRPGVPVTFSIFKAWNFCAAFVAH